MSHLHTPLDLTQQVREFVSEGFRPQFGRLRERFGAEPRWQRLSELGTELWLDTGDLGDADSLWTREFSALTTNNTLLNKEVQKGQYDALIAASARLFGDLHLREQEVILEIAFVLNARHALKLVERFDAYVSVEEHTDLANDVAQAVAYARRYYQICPERFIVKLPFTPAGLLATRILSQEGVPVNHTLGFSARQNYVITRIGRPEYVNVFLGRLGSVMAENKLGNGQYVGERATLASQSAVRHLRETRQIRTRQIGASFREGRQVLDLAGLDVMTMPPKVAQGFLALDVPETEIVDRTGEHYRIEFDEAIDTEALGVDSLWDIDQNLIACVDALEEENLDAFTSDDLVQFFADHGCGDFLPRWTDEQRSASYAEGKIPKLDHWRDALHSGFCAMDSLMNLAGLSSFMADQKAMDDRVRDVIARKS